MQQKGATVAGKKIEVIVKDDAAVPDNTSASARELIVNDKVNVIAGFGVTPAGAWPPHRSRPQAKVPLIVMAAGTSIITERSPYVVRTSFTLAQSSDHRRGEWAAKNGIKKVAAIVSGLRARRRRAELLQGNLHQGRRPIVEEIKVAAHQSGFRAVPAARGRCQARRALHLRAVRAGRHA